MAHPPGRTVWAGLAFGLAVAVFGAYQQLKLPPVLPEMLERYGYPKLLAGGFMSIFALAGLTLSFSLGRMMQTHGTAKFLVGAIALAITGALIILAMPENGWIVLGGRALEGVAMAILAVAGPTLMTHNAGPDHLPVAAALAATWIPLGGLLATGVVEVSDLVKPGEAVWPAVFWVGIAFGLILLLAIRRVGRPGSSVDLKMPVAHRGGVAPDPASRWALILAGACFFLWTAQNMALLTWLPTYLREWHGVDGVVTARLFALPIAMIALFNLVTIPILRRGVPLTLLLSLVLLGQAALFAIVSAFPIAEHPVAGIVALTVYGALAGLTPACLYGLPAAILGGAQTGAGAFGILMTGRNLGVLTGPLMIAGLIESGVFIAWDGGWGAASAAIALASGGSALVAGMLVRHLRPTP